MQDILGNNIYPNQSAVVLRNGVMEKDIKVVNISDYKVLIKNKDDTEYFVDPDAVVVKYSSTDVFIGILVVVFGIFVATTLISYGLTTNLILSFGIGLLLMIISMLLLSWWAA
jgi:hypothetical protein